MVKFIDLCAGIGAGRLGLEQAGFQCMGFSEILPNSIETYKQFFNVQNEVELGDLTKITAEMVPDVDLLIAGFPCQTFSIVGKRAGFDDVRGQIIFSIKKILKAKNIKYFILENVKGLLNHNRGETIKSILNLLDEAGYNVSYRMLSSLHYGLPQARERVYFVGIRKDLKQRDYYYPGGSLLTPVLKDFLINNSERFIFDKIETLKKYLNNKYNKGKYNLDQLLEIDYLILDTRQSDFRLFQGYIPTLRTGRNGLLYIKQGIIRSLSGMESLLFQGFSKKHYDLAQNIPNTILLQQTGNAMSVNVIKELAMQLLPIIEMNEHK